jgi:hypothetical protein
MKKIKTYKNFIKENIGYSDIGDVENFTDIEPLSPIEYDKELGKKGELSEYLRQNGKKFTFGILKCIFNDAIDYKKKRELKKGTYKMFHRLIPMATATLFFPIALMSYIFGTSRAVHKVLIPLLDRPENDYNSFLNKMIKIVVDVSEGEVKMFMENDWFYDIFVMKDNLIGMMRKEHIITFAKYLADKMEKEPYYKLVPHNYIENELKIWLNNEFSIKPPMELKHKPVNKK